MNVICNYKVRVVVTATLILLIKTYIARHIIETLNVFLKKHMNIICNYKGVFLL